MVSTRSVGFIVIVLALLVVGAVCAYAQLPLAGNTDMVGLNELVARLAFFSNQGWLFDLA